MITDIPSITKFIPSGKTPLNNYSYISLIFACLAIIIGNFFTIHEIFSDKILLRDVFHRGKAIANEWIILEKVKTNKQP